jgi:hypothetical protein
MPMELSGSKKSNKKAPLLLPGVCATVTAAMFFREAGASALVVAHGDWFMASADDKN